MKKILTLIAASALTFLGTSVETEARPHNGYHAPASTVYVSGYRQGRPVYTEKYLVGYDRWGRPIFKYRTVQARRGYASPSHHHCPPAYPSYYHSGHHSSGSRVTISFGG
ncbi:MAG: hypothetical protein V4727_00700 [Verrucomicrobiota bacterium]